MAIITCPECGHQVSTRAASCPGCGCPIATGDPPAFESTNKPLSIGEQRKAQLPPDASLNSYTDYIDASVQAHLAQVDLRELLGKIQLWCEELILNGVTSHHPSLLGQLSHLRSLTIWSGDLNDEALLQISKLQTLEK